jgi:hypothetical protein
MKVYNGWVLDINGVEWTVFGSIKIRGKQHYLISNPRGKQSIERGAFLAAYAAEKIKYLRSIALNYSISVN